MRTLLTAITILFSFSSFSQQEIIFPITGNSPLFDWKTVENKPNKFIVDQFIKETPEEFQAYRQRDPKVAFLNLDSLRKDLHFLDLNCDGKDDVLFEGQSSGEAKEVAIFVNSGQSYKKV